NGFFHPSEWIPVVSSALAVGFLLTLLFDPSTVSFRWLSAAILGLQMAAGAAGFLLHLLADVHGPSVSLYQNVIHGAPPFAPRLLPNLAILGLMGLFALGNAEPQSRN